jgi:uncharacterized membrane protein
VNGRGRGLLALAGLLAASALCVAIDEYRTRHLGDPTYRFLIWNLMLAWLPLVFAAIAYAAARSRLTPIVLVFGLLWLLFFPNAPYLLTDFIHLQEAGAAPLWYDALMLSSFAWTALLLGFASLYLMQMIWRRSLGTALSWVGAACALGLGSFGVYIGRFMRWNSWDALLHPRGVLAVIRSELENPVTHPRLVASLVVLAGALIVGYTVMYGVVGARLELDS